jgi:hypothetical protein
VSCFQHPYNLIQFNALGFQQNQVVKEQVSRLAQKKLFVIVFGFDNQLYSFFAYLLGYFVDATGKKAGGIGFLGGILLPVFDNAAQFP